MVIDMQVPLNIVTTGGGKYEGLVNLGTPPQQFEFSVDNGVLAFTMVADEQPIIYDGFSSTGDAVVSGNLSSSVGTDEGGSDAGAAVGVTFAVIVARHVGKVPRKCPFNRPAIAILVVPQRTPTPSYSGHLDEKGLGPGCATHIGGASQPLRVTLDPSGSPWFGRQPETGT